MRKPVFLNKPHTLNLFGHEVERAAPTESELKAHGYTVFQHNKFDHYVEDKDLFSWPSKLITKVKADSHVLLHGTAGSGKNLTIDYLAYKMNRPYRMFAMKEKGGQVADWLGRSTLAEMNGATVSKDEEGSLMRACMGCKIVRNGQQITIPAIICFSDIDRADPAQVEILREALEKGKGTLFNPMTGETIPIAQGTVFIFTANRGLDGDGGRGMLTNPIDPSIGNRIRAVRVPYPTERWERDVVERAHPDLDKNVVRDIVKSVRALRKAAEDGYLNMLSISVRDMLDSADEYKQIRSLMPSQKLAIRFAIDGTIEKMCDDNNYEILRSAVALDLGDLEAPKSATEPTPYDS